MPHPHGALPATQKSLYTQVPSQALFPVWVAAKVYPAASKGLPRTARESFPIPTPAPWPCSLSGLQSLFLAFPGLFTIPKPSQSRAAELLPCWLCSVLQRGRAALGPRGAQLSLSSRKYQRADPGEAEQGSRGRRWEEGAADAKPRADQGRIGCWEPSRCPETEPPPRVLGA